jgi:6-phosphogluconolactonase (cycloisomerase 2 family)
MAAVQFGGHPHRSFMTTRLFLVGVLCTACLLGQGTFVYTNNDPSDERNSVSAFSVGSNGELTMVAGSPFATGGTGLGVGAIAANRITTAIVKDFLYVANAGSNNVSAFSVNPATGFLTLVAGSPFATGGLADGYGISLATTPDDKFLIAANLSSENLTVYSIAANGALSPVAGSPFPAGPGGELDGIKVTPDGKFLAVARPLVNSVSMFGISGLGGLTPVPGSPFPAGGAGIDCNCSSNQLFIGEANSVSTIVSVQNIALNGALSPVAGSPFIGPGSNSNVVVLNPDDSKLFVSNQVSRTVTVFSVATTGALTLVPGSPFAAGVGAPSGMATNQAGTFLYTAGDNSLGFRAISGFSIAPSGALTSVPGSPFSTGFLGSLYALAVFPPKSCCLAPVITGASATPDVLWPPNQKLVDVTIDYTVTDHCPNTCVLTVSSNEPPVNDKEPDWVVIDAHHLRLRAERPGSGNGRTYTITITCTNDTNKQSSTQTVTVVVPHDKGR